MPVTRPLASDDAPALAELLTKNREFLAPWTPSRNDDYFTVQAQQKIVTQALRSVTAVRASRSRSATPVGSKA